MVAFYDEIFSCTIESAVQVIQLLSYATDDFKALYDALYASVRKYGITKNRLYGPGDLHQTPFYLNHREILDAERGAGYWLWKSYYILETLKKMGDGEVLLYADAACRFIASPKPLIKLVQQSESGVMAFHLKPLKAQAWCKRDAFIFTGCDNPDYYQSDKVMGGLLLFRKCERAIRLVEEWLQWCCLPGAINDDPSKLGVELEGFTDHRHDQALLGLLLKKHGIIPYRNPSIWGNHLKMPEYRVKGEHLFYPFRLQEDFGKYSDEPDRLSPYGTLVELNRKGFYYTQPDNRFITRLKRKLAGLKSIR